jgi:DHA2 family methylenomycin A resistance protein-like MFS transporter
VTATTVSAARGVRAGAVLAVMCVGMFLVQLDVTVVNVALPHIGVSLHANLAGLQWVVDAYTVVLAAFLLAGGAAGDRFGHRGVVLTGLAVFGLASLACAAAPTLGYLLGARAAQGLGAAILLPGTLAVVTRTFPDGGAQARALGIWAGVAATALPAGPVLGGVLVTFAGWRSIFWLPLPVVAAALVATWRLVPRTAPSGAARFDVPGVLLAALSLSGLVLAVINAGNAGPIALTAAAAALCAAATAGFLAREYRAPAPVFPLDLLRRLPFVVSNGVAAAMNFVGIGVVFVLTLYLQELRHRDALTAGAMLLPLFVPLAVMAPLTGRIVARTGPRPPMLAGLALGAAGGLCLLLITPASPYADLLPVMLGVGAGMGLLTPSVVAAAMRTCPPARQGLASGVNNTARQAGGAIGIAVFGVIAGTPGNAGRFAAGLHVLAVLAAALWIAAMAVTVHGVPSTSTGRNAAKEDDGT